MSSATREGTGIIRQPQCAASTECVKGRQLAGIDREILEKP
jgi:hypothetical protein